VGAQVGAEAETARTAPAPMGGVHPATIGTASAARSRTVALTCTIGEGFPSPAVTRVGTNPVGAESEGQRAIGPGA